MEMPQNGRRLVGAAQPGLCASGWRRAADPPAPCLPPYRGNRRKASVRIVNVAHAGDGNVHPILLMDERDRDLTARAQAASREVLEECIACGGSITAEHGVGVEKIDLMERLFAPADLRAMHRVRQAFDPAGRLNPGKKLPVHHCRDADASLMTDRHDRTRTCSLDQTGRADRRGRAWRPAIGVAYKSGTPSTPSAAERASITARRRHGRASGCA